MINKDRYARKDALSGSFMEELRKANPAGAALLDRNAAKADIARSLLGMRKGRRMTQGEVSAASGLTQPMISRLEAPLGPMPDLDSVMRYVTACKGRLSMSFRLEESSGATGNALQCGMVILV